MKCAHCNHSGRLLLTLYKEYLCEDCWDDYINTDLGKVEYFVSITTGEDSINDFDADFLCEVVKSWRENKNLTSMSKEEIEECEEIALMIGLLDKYANYKIFEFQEI